MSDVTATPFKVHELLTDEAVRQDYLRLAEESGDAQELANAAQQVALSRKAECTQ